MIYMITCTVCSTKVSTYDQLFGVCRACQAKGGK